MEFKKISKIIYYIIWAAVVAIALLLVMSFFPIPGNIQTLNVLSGSMEPAIGTGSIVVIKPASEYKVGDVITFKTEGRISITHRIVDSRIQDGEIFFKTKGDANGGVDSEEVFVENIIGKVLFSIPWLGYLIHFIQTPIGIMVFIFVPSIIIVYEEIKKIGREAKKMMKKKTLGNGNGSDDLKNEENEKTD